MFPLLFVLKFRLTTCTHSNLQTIINTGRPAFVEPMLTDRINEPRAKHKSLISSSVDLRVNLSDVPAGRAVFLLLLSTMFCHRLNERRANQTDGFVYAKHNSSPPPRRSELAAYFSLWPKEGCERSELGVDSEYSRLLFNFELI